MTATGRSSRVTGVWSILALLIFFKLVGVGLTVFTDLNTFAQSDVTTFAANAEIIAEELRAGRIPYGSIRDITYTWPLTISVFWFLPGPSWTYARIFVSLLGAVSIYNVYIVGRYHHSPKAGFMAALPMIVYPSFIFVHASILREAVVHFGLTTAVRLLFVGQNQSSQARRIIAVMILLGLVTIYRIPNLFIYVAMVATAVLVSGRTIPLDRAWTFAVAGVGGVVSVLFLALKFEGTAEIVSYISTQRAARAHGDAVYLAEILPSTIFEMIAFSWIGASYFYLVPFPWMISAPAWLIAGLEAMGNLLFLLFSLRGFRYLYHRARPVALSLAVGVILAGLMYGLIEGNVGPAVRHRQQFVWIIYLFGAIGMFESFKIVTGER